MDLLFQAACLLWLSIPFLASAKHVDCSLSRNTSSHLKESSHCCQILYRKRFVNPKFLRQELVKSDSCPEIYKTCLAVSKKSIPKGREYTCHCGPRFCKEWFSNFNGGYIGRNSPRSSSHRKPESKSRPTEKRFRPTKQTASQHPLLKSLSGILSNISAEIKSRNTSSSEHTTTRKAINHPRAQHGDGDRNEKVLFPVAKNRSFPLLRDQPRLRNREMKKALQPKKNPAVGGCRSGREKDEKDLRILTYFAVAYITGCLVAATLTMFYCFWGRRALRALSNKAREHPHQGGKSKGDGRKKDPNGCKYNPAY